MHFWCQVQSRHCCSSCVPLCVLCPCQDMCEWCGWGLSDHQTYDIPEPFGQKTRAVYVVKGCVKLAQRSVIIQTRTSWLTTKCIGLRRNFDIKSLLLTCFVRVLIYTKPNGTHKVCLNNEYAKSLDLFTHFYGITVSICSFVVLVKERINQRKKIKSMMNFFNDSKSSPSTR